VRKRSPNGTTERWLVRIDERKERAGLQPSVPGSKRSKGPGATERPVRRPGRPLMVDSGIGAAWAIAALRWEAAMVLTRPEWDPVSDPGRDGGGH
jgi:hypothetical protein